MASLSPSPPGVPTNSNEQASSRSPDNIETGDPAKASSPSSEGLSSPSITNDSMAPPRSKASRLLAQRAEESVRSSPSKPGAAEGVKDSTATAAGSAVQDSTVDVQCSHLQSKPARRFAPEPVETTSRSSRRKFNVEPVETSTRKSKDKDNPPGKEESAPKPRRKFAPEPVETTARSSKDKKSREEDTAATKPRRKFVPEPIETTVISRRRNPSLDEICEEPESNQSSASSRESSGPRKFSPELLETAKGSYRRVHLPSPPNHSPRKKSPTPEKDEAEEETAPEESRFSAAALARKHPEALRQHSFAVPDLPSIDSNTEDEESDAPSLTDSSSSVASVAKKATPAAKDSYTEYVLRLAAETISVEELQEQAMAAYINERPHEPVDHFALLHDDEDDGPLPVPMFLGHKGADIRTFRRSSAAELALELDNMRKHHEQLEAAKRELKADTAGHSRFSAAALASRHHQTAKALQKRKPKADDERSERARIRAAASPPMLGDDLVFPLTISPKMTRCDPDQKPRPRRADSDDEPTEVSHPELWHANPRLENNAEDGLWMGMCQAGPWQQPASPQNGLRSGIQTPMPATPAAERNNPFESTTPNRGNRTPARRLRPVSGQALYPLTPPRSQDGDDAFTNTIDKKLQIEKQIEEEFPNSVISQIYNYLSLGYPSLAHAFDDELSKISRISIEDLRKDDTNLDAKGYIGAPEGDGWDESEVVGKCRRWEALRLYIKEWARQSPNFADERRRACLGANEDWGARARRGSWAH